jgi:hypothetical protein
MQGFLPILPLFLPLCSFFLTLKLLIYPGFTFIQQTLNKLLNEGGLIIKWERKVKNKGNAVYSI